MLEQVELPEPTVFDPNVRPPGAEAGVAIEVRAASVSLAEVRQVSRRSRPNTKAFVPGVAVAGLVRSAPADSALRAGDRVAARCLVGGFAEVTVAAESLTFDLPAELSFAEGVALVHDYYAAYLSLVCRGHVREGETVLFRYPSSGLGNAAMQVARGLGAKPLAVVANDDEATSARMAGADQVIHANGDWPVKLRALVAEGGVDVVIDPGSERDSLCLPRSDARFVLGDAYREDGDVTTPALAAEIDAELDTMLEEGFVQPLVGTRLPLEDAAWALDAITDQRGLGSVVLDVGPGQ